MCCLLCICRYSWAEAARKRTAALDLMELCASNQNAVCSYHAAFSSDSRESPQPTCRTAQYRASSSIQSTSCRGRSQINCCKAVMPGSSWGI